MISKAKIKHIKALQAKKYRKEHQCFLVEGIKSVDELLRSDFEVVWVAITSQFMEARRALLNQRAAEWTACTEAELVAAGTFQTNDGALAIVRCKPNTPPQISNTLVLALDTIRDPGNLGTIIRTADWFGVEHIVASVETADFYNPKVIAATMGSFCRVNMYYTDLEKFLASVSKPVYGAFMNGTDVHRIAAPENGILVIGNEANGISAALEKFISNRVTIPRLGKAESLNAAIATGILLDVFTQKKD
ncbi:MAG: RNA methyltransferase [Cytophagales bacterium]|nr:RNA methyltransferase [Cytophagales bacterium]